MKKGKKLGRKTYLIADICVIRDMCEFVAASAPKLQRLSPAMADALQLEVNMLHISQFRAKVEDVLRHATDPSLSICLT